MELFLHAGQSAQKKGLLSSLLLSLKQEVRSPHSTRQPQLEHGLRIILSTLDFIFLGDAFGRSFFHQLKEREAIELLIHALVYIIVVKLSPLYLNMFFLQLSNGIQQKSMEKKCNEYLLSYLQDLDLSFFSKVRASIFTFVILCGSFHFSISLIITTQNQRQAISNLYLTIFKALFRKHSFKIHDVDYNVQHETQQGYGSKQINKLYIFAEISVFDLQNLKMKMFSIAFLGLLLMAAPIQLVMAADCSAVTCLTGYDCIEGVCVRQKPQPRKKLCSLNFDLAPVKCTNRNYECNDVVDSPSCGFSPNGSKTPFSNDCLPCLDFSISFYYNVPCEQAPQVCSHDQECINGKCMALFKGQRFENQASCSSNSQCRPIIERCVSGKCVKLTDIVNVLQSSGIEAPQI